MYDTVHEQSWLERTLVFVLGHFFSLVSLFFLLEAGYLSERVFELDLVATGPDRTGLDRTGLVVCDTFKESFHLNCMPISFLQVDEWTHVSELSELHEPSRPPGSSACPCRSGGHSTPECLAARLIGDLL